MKTQVLNKQENATHRRVFEQYCLVTEDFETELEYNKYLEERETVVMNMVQKKNLEKAEAMFAKFGKDFSKQIGARNAEILNSRDVLKNWKVLPLQAQMENEKRKKSSRRNQAFQFKLDYKAEEFAKEANSRFNNWQMGMAVSRFQESGSDDSWYVQRAKEEYANSLTRPPQLIKNTAYKLSI